MGRSKVFGLFLLSMALALPACGTLGAGRVYRESVAEDCRYYDDAHLAWNAVALTGSALGAAGGAAGALVEGLSDADEAEDWTIGLTITGGIGSVLAVVGNWLSGEYAARYADRCMEDVVFMREPEAMPEASAPEPDDTVVLPVVPEPVEELPAEAPDVEPGPGETGTGADGLAPEELAPAIP